MLKIFLMIHTNNAFKTLVERSIVLHLSVKRNMSLTVHFKSYLFKILRKILNLHKKVSIYGILIFIETFRNLFDEKTVRNVKSPTASITEITLVCCREALKFTDFIQEVLTITFTRTRTIIIELLQEP